MNLSVRIPIKAVNTSNSREHWRAIAARAKAHRAGAAVALKCTKGFNAAWIGVDHGLLVTMTRVAPRALDDDGAVTSLKAVRDGIADALNLPSDRDPRVAWKYSQQRGAPKEYAVVVELAWNRVEVCPTCGVAKQ